MRITRARLSFGIGLFVLGLVSAASAVTIDWTTIGNGGNACDTQAGGCFGAVGSVYRIGTYEVTNAQYAEFLNAKAASDPLALYNTSMDFRNITRSGTSGSFTYRALATYAEHPVTYVSFYDAMRFANWLHNGQGAGDTETGAYTLLGGTATPSNGLTATRNPGAGIFIPNEDEWYKAAYYSAASAGYFDYPAGTDTPTVCSAPTATANRANCSGAAGQFPTRYGSYPGSASPYGTFDQGGNVAEWNETILGTLRGLRGGSSSLFSPASNLAASARGSTFPTDETGIFGFRVAMIPEPATGLLLAAGLLGLASQRRLRA